MNIIKRDTLPIYKDFEHFLDSFLGRKMDDASFVEASTWAPAVDIREEKDCFLVTADLPGVSKENIKISLEHNVLTLRGERHLEKTANEKGYTRKERMHGEFYRRFSLPESVDEHQISAQYVHGVLSITLPKKNISTQKSINITVE